MAAARPSPGQDALLRAQGAKTSAEFVVEAVHGDRVTLSAKPMAAVSALEESLRSGAIARLEFVDRFGVYDADVSVVRIDGNALVIAVPDGHDDVRRRAYARLDAPLDASCLLLDVEQNAFTPLDATVVDIGGGGAALAVPAIAPIGATMVCSIALPDEAPVVTVGTTLAPDADPRDQPNRRHVRVQFTLIAEPDRDRLLRHILRTLGSRRDP